MKTSIILPTYKEKDNIVELIQVIFDTLQPDGLDFEIVVVDDNSPDGTAEVVRRQFDGNVRVKLWVRTEERGLATAIRYGIEHSDGDILVFMDTDFNHDPAIIPQMIKFLEYYDIIIGSRFVMAGGMEDRFRQFSSLVYNYGIRLLFGTPVHDNLSGFFSIYRNKLESMDLDQVYYGYGDYFIRAVDGGPQARLQYAGNPGLLSTAEARAQQNPVCFNPHPIQPGFAGAARQIVDREDAVSQEQHPTSLIIRQKNNRRRTRLPPKTGRMRPQRQRPASRKPGQWPPTTPPKQAGLCRNWTKGRAPPPLTTFRKPCSAPPKPAPPPMWMSAICPTPCRIWTKGRARDRWMRFRKPSLKQPGQAHPPK